MEHFEIACRMLQDGCTLAQLAPIINNMKEEIAALDGVPTGFKEFVGAKVSFAARDETVWMLGILEHHARRSSAQAVIAMVIAYLRRDPAFLEVLTEIFAPTPAAGEKRGRKSKPNP